MADTQNTCCGFAAGPANRADHKEEASCCTSSPDLEKEERAAELDGEFSAATK